MEPVAAEISTGKRVREINFSRGGNVSPLGASDLVISRGFPEFGPSKKGLLLPLRVCNGPHLSTPSGISLLKMPLERARWKAGPFARFLLMCTATIDL